MDNCNWSVTTADSPVPSAATAAVEVVEARVIAAEASLKSAGSDVEPAVAVEVMVLAELVAAVESVVVSGPAGVAAEAVGSGSTGAAAAGSTGAAAAGSTGAAVEAGDSTVSVVEAAVSTAPGAVFEAAGSAGSPLVNPPVEGWSVSSVPSAGVVREKTGFC